MTEYRDFYIYQERTGCSVEIDGAEILFDSIDAAKAAIDDYFQQFN